MKINELFPPGAVPEDDTKTHRFLGQIDGFFSGIIERLEEVFGSTPNNKKGPLYERWQKVTGSGDPESAFRRRCDYHKGENLSNTKEHFKSVNPGTRLEFAASRVKVFLGDPTKTINFKAGSRIGRPLREFERPEETIESYEKMRHAHIIMEYHNA